MAKKKSEPKTETPAVESVEPTPAPKKKATKAVKAKAAKPAVGAAPVATPMVDTQLAAQAAARMLTAKATGMSSAAPMGDRKETSAFKQLKQSFNKPHAAGMGNILNNSASGAAKKANMPFQGGKPVTSHNQTFGADASKNFVPRRTGG